MDSKETTALKIIKRYSKSLSEENFKVDEVQKNEYSYQILIYDENDKVILLVFFGKKGNKVILQGNKESELYNKVYNLIFGEKLLQDTKPDSEPEKPYIGTDESGKGDYFGPLVIAGVCLDTTHINYLRSIGIRDSKELSNLQIKQLASEIKKVNESRYDIVHISPEKYNELYSKFGNLNLMMGWAHARVIENLLNKCDAEEAISDKFGNEKIILDALQEKGRSIILNQVTKAEKFMAVAAASILARDAVNSWFNNQTKKYKIEIPKGSSVKVEIAAKKFLNQYSSDELKKLVKLHFKTTKKIFNN